MRKGQRRDGRYHLAEWCWVRARRVLSLLKLYGVVGCKAPPLPAVLLTCSWLFLSALFLAWAYEGISSLDLLSSPWPSGQLYWTRPRETPCWSSLLHRTHIWPWKHSCTPCPNNPWSQHISDLRAPPLKLQGRPSLIPGFLGQVSCYNAPRPGATTGLLCLPLLEKPFEALQGVPRNSPS